MAKTAANKTATPATKTKTRTTGTKVTGKKATPAKAKAAKVEKAPRVAKDLTPTQETVLGLLKNTSTGKGKTRAALAEATGIAKGWSKLLGAATKDDNGASGGKSLMGKGYVKSEKHEGESITYFITAAGKSALEKAKAK